jgi:modulator of FtsH protease HflK
MSATAGHDPKLEQATPPHPATTTVEESATAPAAFRHPEAPAAHAGAGPGWPPRARAYVLGVLLLALAASYLGSGFYTVGADERGIVRRFGAPAGHVGPGMHYRLPWPIDRVDVLKTTSVMKTGVGFALPDEASGAQPATGMELLTGDTNILSVALVLQYVIRNPADFLFQVEDPKALIDGVAQAVLTETVAGMPIDELLTTGRVALQDKVKKETQAVLDRYRSGVQLTSANIMSITLDRTVAEAFQDVADAMADREKLQNDARTYENDLIPKARGEARTTLAAADAYRQQRVAEAVGESGRFLALLKEYEKARDITRVRLYLEAMQKILPKVKLYVLDSDNGRAPLNLRVTGQP